MNRRSLISNRMVSLAMAFAGVLLLSVPVFASDAGSFDRSYQVNGPVSLEVLSRSGDITIHKGSSGSVSVHGKLHVDNSWLSGDHKEDVQAVENNPPIQQNGNSIRIDYANGHNISIDYEITVPENTSVRTHTGSGEQSVEDLRGKIELESGSGDMKLGRLTGEMHFQTGSGTVRGHELAGPINIKSGSGDVELNETGEGDVEVRTGSGQIAVKGINGGLRAEAGSGNISAQGSAKNSWSVRTGSGNVTLDLPSEAAFDLDVSSGSGSVSTNHPVAAMVEGHMHESHKTLVGKVRGGGPSISVRTGSGDIEIE